MTGIIDYGLGNLGSIKNMLYRIGEESEITSNPSEIEKFERIILPGVGSFDIGIKNLKNRGWIDVLNQEILVNEKPILGICLGMQLMCNSSEEGQLEGLKWIDTEVVKFEFNDNSHKIPHMGWNEVYHNGKDFFFNNLMNNPRYYFVHSFYVKKSFLNPEIEYLKTHYHEEFISGFKTKNIIGVQFHPEKSHKYGFDFLSNFTKLK